MQISTNMEEDKSISTEDVKMMIDNDLPDRSKNCEGLI